MLQGGTTTFTSPLVVTRPQLILLVVVNAAFSICFVEADIASATDDFVGVLANTLAERGYGVDNGGGNRCSARKFQAIANAIDDVEDLELDVPVNIAFDTHQKKRFLLYINTSTSLTINFSQQVVRKIYFNQTINLSRSFKSDQGTVVLPCALRGQYDIFVQARQRGSIKIEAQAVHPQSSWPLLNRTHYISIRTQNRVRKRQMIVKWDKSKFDFHAVHYCLVVNTRQRQLNFCSAVNDYFMRAVRHLNVGASANCYPGSLMDYIWLKPPERTKKIDPRSINIICTGSHTQQLLRGVLPNHTYYLDVFGVHTRRQNLTFHIASMEVDFNRTHPVSLRANMLTMKKISGLHGVQVFSFKIPTGSFATIYNQSRASAMPTTALQLRYLILPCGGSEIDAKILRQRRVIGNISGIYRPTYIRLSEVQEGERYIVRFTPSNEDEMLRANKVGLAVTTNGIFKYLPELPENITVFELRTRCSLTTIAWYSSPDNRTMRYCIIVFNLPQRNRSSIDYTNYCLDFGKRVMQHPLFDSIKCVERTKSSSLETHTIFNLTPGETYIIYVTANLSEGKPLPYQSLRITMNHQCSYEILESREQPSYY
ncbi:protein NDNF [Eurosta solidaginis]|uniref:protein NDNF n=1 Tax=Eurosta solidaginis TaxID=178769 RepID=UPI0035311515